MEHQHKHGHEHDHNHQHGHHHEHHHSHEETVALSWADMKLEAHTHEQAATVSMDIRPNAECTKTFPDLVAVMQGIAQDVENAGGIVGHIKAFAKQGDSSVHASVTAADLAPTIDGDQSCALAPSTDVQLVAIALLVTEDDLLAICKDALNQ